MALARVLSCAVVGLEGSLIEVEVDVSRAGMPSMAIVGLPDAAVNESKERVRSAIRNSGGTLPQPSRIVVNLAPASATASKTPRVSLPTPKCAPPKSANTATWMPRANPSSKPPCASYTSQPVPTIAY